MASDLLTLAERVEKATGPDRELGRQVLRAMGWRQSGHGYFLGPLTGWTSPDGKTWFDDDNFARHDPTASLDAAMTLVPEGWHTGAYYQGPSGQPHRWILRTIRDGETFYRDREGKAPTPARALTAAAIRAQASSVGNGEMG